uniref:SERPIN domain-containing protein n=1 Tax=Onchocerca volvulus TaxID=6282 RepID=A0A2K6VT32_ONCVO
MDHAQLNFTLGLLKNLAQNDKSVILSPLSVSTSLFMTYLAADGTTKQQLQDVLGGTASVSEFRLHFAKLLVEMANVENENFTLNLANRLYVEQNFPTKESFSRMLQYYHNESLHKFNNRKKDVFVKEVNEWISDKTNNKITELVTADSINDNTKMLLLNSIYFKGTWLSQFLPQGTRQIDFHISAKRTKKVPMMRNTGHWMYYEDNSVKVIRLPYIGDDIEMVLILPRIRFGLSNVLQKLTSNNLLRYFRDAKTAHVDLRLPKFELKEKRNLKETLKKLGITHAFNDSADFTELTNDTVSVNNVIHAGFIAIDEKGTESAAATVIDIEDRSFPSTEFIADQPFIFLIVQNLKTVLFAGQFVN